MVTVAVTGPLKPSGASTVIPLKVKVAPPSEEPPATWATSWLDPPGMNSWVLGMIDTGPPGGSSTPAVPGLAERVPGVAKLPMLGVTQM